MPHAFKATPDHPAVAYLVRLHADIGGRIQKNKRQAEQLAADMKAVEAVIQMFDPDYSVRAISARRRVTGNPWFKRGTLFRAALDALRGATAPLTVRDIADAIRGAGRGWGAETVAVEGLASHPVARDGQIYYLLAGQGAFRLL